MFQLSYEGRRLPSHCLWRARALNTHCAPLTAEGVIFHMTRGGSLRYDQ